MSFTEKLLAYTKQIEKRLAELGGVGIGLMERARSLPSLPRSVILDLRNISWVRNQLVHDPDYQFAGNEEMLLGLCKEVVAYLSTLRPLDGSSQAQATPNPSQPTVAPKAIAIEPESSRPPTVDAKFRRETVETNRRADGATSAGIWNSGAKASQDRTRKSAPDFADYGANPADTSRSQDPVPPQPQPLTRSWLIPWLVALGIALLCLAVLPKVVYRTVETGFWPFDSTHREPIWFLVWLLTVTAARGSFVLVQRQIAKGRKS